MTGSFETITAARRRLSGFSHTRLVVFDSTSGEQI